MSTPNCLTSLYIVASIHLGYKVPIDLVPRPDDTRSRILGGTVKRPSRAPSKLSESLHQRLNMYALVAGAAGVSALALMPPAEAKIVYTPAHIRGLSRKEHLR
jgi:hypothetical protein